MDESWRSMAACRGMEPKQRDKIFFPQTSARFNTYRKARPICDTCIVRTACLDYAIELQMSGFPLKGCWGSTSEDERDDIIWRRRQETLDIRIIAV